ncbi:leucine-rich repeat protein [Perkinsela sp. CCAP 1560/4]|nr:leucine-rich repeat protein [Perkinsela sp. CCAP 1560/4]|eukprot:KNH08590.1 leucine-rich repeat protein [Perkinsela sp. CCAP 1560/4]
MRLAHMKNAKSREHAHTCRKARAILKLRYKKKNQLSGTICLTALPPALECLRLSQNNFEGSLDFRRLPNSIRRIYLEENRFSGTIDFGNLPESIRSLNVRKNALSGRVQIPPGLSCWSRGPAKPAHLLLEGNTDLIVKRMRYYRALKNNQN